MRADSTRKAAFDFNGLGETNPYSAAGTVVVVVRGRDSLSSEVSAIVGTVAKKSLTLTLLTAAD